MSKSVAFSERVNLLISST
uniref:Uncharacterized protein n=1 Tax=Rhizophora mucronata TaxID=61149 RepID=A0A2P2PUV0_RHIMU